MMISMIAANAPQENLGPDAYLGHAMLRLAMSAAGCGPRFIDGLTLGLCNLAGEDDHGTPEALQACIALGNPGDESSARFASIARLLVAAARFNSAFVDGLALGLEHLPCDDPASVLAAVNDSFHRGDGPLHAALSADRASGEHNATEAPRPAGAGLGASASGERRSGLVADGLHRSHE